MAWGGRRLRRAKGAHYAPGRLGSPPEEPWGRTDGLAKLTLAVLGGLGLALSLGPAAMPGVLALSLLPALLRPRLAPYALALSAGALLTALSLHHSLERRLTAAAYEEGEAILAITAVQGWPPQSAYAEVLAWRSGSSELRRVRRARLSLYAPLPLREGARWRMTLRLRASKGAQNLGRPDPERTLFARGADAVGYPKGPAWALARADPGPLARLRQYLQAALRPLRPEARAVFTALLLGAASPPEALPWDRLALLGVVHLFVVSGFHLGLVFVALRVLFALVTPGLPGRWLVLPAGLLLASYAAVTGAGLPVQRAWLGALLLLMALGLGRTSRPGRGLALAALALGASAPEMLLAPGAALSFFAVLVLLWPGGDGPGLRGLLALQGRLSLAMAAPLAAFFGWMPAWGLVVNLFLGPLLGAFLLPLGFGLLALVLLGFAPALGALQVLGDGVQGLLGFLALLLGRAAPLAPVAGLPLALAVLLALVTLTPGPPVVRFSAALGVMALLWPAPGLPPGTFRFTVFDVGQGSVALVETSEHRLLVDTGPAWGDAGASAFAAQVKPALRALGVSQLDGVLLTHEDRDHAGGLPAAQALFPGALLLGPGGEPCHRGRRWRWDGVNFAVLHPEPNPRAGQGNAQSCVLAINAGARRALLLADVPRFVERRLAGELPPQDLVLAAHHGSRGSSARVLVQRTAPRFVIFSAGLPSPFSHPHDAVVARWRSVGARPVQTGAQGMVRWDSRWPGRVRCGRAGLWWQWRPSEDCGGP
ncbi:MAG: ComEC/Rec2 family competence protein [Pseudomonadales bacterium]|nr:ComEC/Rec2 family competence protein [Pseudomonadales bacterium]